MWCILTVRSSCHHWTHCDRLWTEHLTHSRNSREVWMGACRFRGIQGNRVQTAPFRAGLAAWPPLDFGFPGTELCVWAGGSGWECLRSAVGTRDTARALCQQFAGAWFAWCQGCGKEHSRALAEALSLPPLGGWVRVWRGSRCTLQGEQTRLSSRYKARARNVPLLCMACPELGACFNRLPSSQWVWEPAPGYPGSDARACKGSPYLGKLWKRD